MMYFSYITQIINRNAIAKAHDRKDFIHKIMTEQPGKQVFVPNQLPQILKGEIEKQSDQQKDQKQCPVVVFNGILLL